MKPNYRSLILIQFTAVLTACAPQLVTPGPKITEPRLTEKAAIMADGAKLPLHHWRPSEKHGIKPKAILLALHGFNDYGLFVKTRLNISPATAFKPMPMISVDLELLHIPDAGRDAALLPSI